MGNKQINQLVESYCVTQNSKGLKGPVYQSHSRLCYNLTFYDEKGKFYIHEKVYFLSKKEALKLENYTEIIEKNQEFFKINMEVNYLPFFIIPHWKQTQELEWIFSRQELKFSLTKWINSKQELFDEEKIWIAGQILLCVMILQDLNVSHSNLTPDHILLTSSNLVYLTDFSLVNPHFYLDQDLDKINLFNQQLDKRCYFAPEIFVTDGFTENVNFQDTSNENQKKIDKLKKADVFSIGCIFFTLFTNGKVLFNHKDLKQFKNSNNPDQIILPLLDRIENNQLKDLIKLMLNYDYTKRISVVEAFKQFNDIFFEKDQYFFYYLNYLLRHKKFTYLDHQIFLSTCALAFIKSQGYYGFSQEVWKFSKFSEINFFRVLEILKEIRSEKFDERLTKILNSSNTNLLNTINKFQNFLEKFIITLTVQKQKKQSLEQIVNKQEIKNIKKKNRISLNWKERHEKMISEILSNKNYKINLNSKSLISSIMIKFISQNLNFTKGSETKSFALDVLNFISNNVPQTDIIVFIIPFFIYSLSEDKSISQLKLIRTITSIIQNIKFIQDERFCKQHSVENYIFTLVDKILNSPNPMLHMEFINNIHTFMQLNYVFNVSFIYHKHKLDTTDAIIQNKLFLVNSFKIKQFFTLWIKQLLETLDYKNLVLKEIPNIVHFLDENVLFKHINSLIINFINFHDSKIQALQTIPYLFINQPQSIRNSFPLIAQNLKSDIVDIVLACLTTVIDILLNFKRKDIYFYKQIAKHLVIVYENNSNEYVLQKLKQAFQLLFSQLNEKEINVYFLYYIENLNDMEYDSLSQITLQDLDWIINKLYIKKKIEDQQQEIKQTSSYLRYESFFKQRNLSMRRSTKLFKQKTKSVIEEFYRFVFSLYYFEMNVLKQSAIRNYSFDNLLQDITKNLNSEVNQTEPWNFTKHPESINFQLILKLKQILTSCIENNSSSVNQIYNKEIFFAVFEFFDKFIEIFNLKNFYYKISYENVIDSSILRQMNPKGNLVSTIYDSNAPINCLGKGKSDIFLSGSEAGELFVYNLNNLKKNVPSLLNQKYNFDSNKSIIKILGFENTSQAIIGLRQNQLAHYDVEKNCVIQSWDTKNEISDACFLNENYSSYENSFIVSEVSGEINIFDIRQPQKVNNIALGYLLGIPRVITSTKLFNQSYIGTMRGYLIRYDMRRNLFGECYQLFKKKKPLPILGISEFIPSSEFKNLNNDQDYLLLTFPSKKNEFAIFNTGMDQSFDSEHKLPKFLFYSDFSDQSLGEIVELPYMVLHKEQSLMNIKQNFEFNFSTLLRKMSLRDKIYKQRPDNYLRILNQHFNFLINQNKINRMNHLSSDKDIFFQLSKYNKTFTKVITLPDLPTYQNSRNISLDNIIITAGEDRNIRFLNFGNTFKIQSPFLQYSGNLKSFHISNDDLVERSYEFYYSGDVCILKEQPGKSVHKKNKIEKIENAFGIIRSFDEGGHDNGLSDVQNYNFGSKFHLKKKAFGKSLATPSHDLPINDIILMNYLNTLFIVSAGEDGLVKLWN